MSILINLPEPNLFNEICKEFASRRPPFPDYEKEKENNIYNQFDPSKHTPVLYGKLQTYVDGDFNLVKEFDPSVSHPATIGISLIDEPVVKKEVETPMLPHKDKCSAREYCQYYIFPILMPALEKMLEQAKIEKCFERKRTKFNALDFLTHYLYTNNPLHMCRRDIQFENIPFVEELWKTNPRPPLPLSLIWSEPEATLVIQSWWRGYKIRCEEKVTNLRKWQTEWREDNEAAIKDKVDKFWQNRGVSPEIDDTNSETGEKITYSRPNTGTKSVHPTAYDRMNDPTKPEPIINPKKPAEGPKKPCEFREACKEVVEEKIEEVLPEPPPSPTKKGKKSGKKSPGKR